MDLPLGNNDACVTISHLLCIKNPFPLEQANKQTNTHTHTYTHGVDKGLQLYVQ